MCSARGRVFWPRHDGNGILGGTNGDGIYVAYQNKCVRLDPATGKKVSEFSLPKFAGMKESPRWGYLHVAGDYLIGGADPLFDPKLDKAIKAVDPKAGDDKDPSEKRDYTALAGAAIQVAASLVAVVALIVSRPKN